MKVILVNTMGPKFLPQVQIIRLVDLTHHYTASQLLTLSVCDVEIAS